VRDDRIATICLAAGGVATTPWRLKACEAALAGARVDDAVLRAASALAAEGARPLGGNGFKVELLQRTVHRLLADTLVTPPTSP
jgi:xanthine dehydrogenase YagS FAD-binding subunit